MLIGGIKMVLELKEESWEQEVVKSDLPVIVDFWASWVRADGRHWCCTRNGHR